MDERRADAFRRLLDELSGERTEPLVPKRLVVDLLLDLRNAAGGRVVLVEAVDSVLSDIPGATVTTGGWWREQIVFLRSIADAALTDVEPIR